MSGGLFNVPLVIRMATGAGRQLAAQHSTAWRPGTPIPGLRVVAPATLEDARGMLPTALTKPDPVVIFEHVMLYNLEGDLAASAGPVDLDRAAVRRPGSDLTLITYGGSPGWSGLRAALSSRLLPPIPGAALRLHSSNDAATGEGASRLGHHRVLLLAVMIVVGIELGRGRCWRKGR